MKAVNGRAGAEGSLAQSGSLVAMDGSGFGVEVPVAKVRAPERVPSQWQGSR